MKTGVELIAAERQRQIKVEGWTPENDDEYECGELSRAAYCYSRNTLPIGVWPWILKWWKPTTELRDLVKAGALYLAEADNAKRQANRIAAEIDRIQASRKGEG